MTGYHYACRLRDDEVEVKRIDGHEALSISFRRTVRVADNQAKSLLPPDLGKLPLYKVKDHESTLPTNVVAKGGLMMPMYQREAMWIKFNANSSFAVKVYIGKVNAVSGKVATAVPIEEEGQVRQTVVQDYMVVPGQQWLDGIATRDGVVKQFVATRLGDGYTVEAQVTGEEVHAGLQIEVTPAIVNTRLKTTIKVTNHEIEVYFAIGARTTGDHLMRAFVKRLGLNILYQRFLFNGQKLQRDDLLIEHLGMEDGDTVEVCEELVGGGWGPPPPRRQPAEMGLAAGGKIEQTIVRDPWPSSKWNKSATLAFNVQILNAAAFESVTGLRAPETPITVATYEKLGYPFSKQYEEPSDIYGDFSNVKTIGEMDGLEERNYDIPVKVIDPRSDPAKEAVNNGRDAEDITNPTGPFKEFRSVAEIEQEIREMSLSGTT